MKTRYLSLILILIALVSLPFSNAAEGTTTPNRGRLLKASEPDAEFLVLADRRIQITFLDSEGKAIAPQSQVVTVTTGERLSPTKLTFTKSGDTLVSDSPIPEGNNLPAVVQIRSGESGKPVTEKFHINLAQCPECDNSEYACSCGH